MDASVVAQVTELEHLPITALREKWKALFSAVPPRFCNRKHLVGRLAYRIQELAYGGLSREARQQLNQLADGIDSRQTGDKNRQRNPDTPLTGTRLIREWQGCRYEVTALDSGFEYAGKRYRSLSAIATAITGTKWNGPVFFGLRRRTQGGAHGG